MGKYGALHTARLAILVILIAMLLGCTPMVTDMVIDKENIPIERTAIEISISGNNVVWIQEYSSKGIYEIKLHNLETHTSHTITSVQDIGNHCYFNLDIGGDTVVWSEYSTETGYDIWAYDLGLQEKYAICDKPGNQQYPRIASSYILWREEEKHEKYTHWNYYTFDLMTEEILPVILVDVDHGSYAPQFEGDIVAWQDIAWIYGRLTGFRELADTDGKTVIWLDVSPTSPSGGEGRAGDIIAYNYETKNELRLPRTWAYVHRLAVSGDLIIWTQGDEMTTRTALSHVYAYDMTTGKVFPVAEDDTDKGEIAIDNNTIVWIERYCIQVVKIKSENAN